MKRVHVVAAVIRSDMPGGQSNKILLAKRLARAHQGGKWEFPGGKVEKDETPEAALVRELKEELGIEACLECMQPFSFASHSYPDFHLLMPLFLCRRWEGLPHPQEGQQLKWVFASRLDDFPMPPADRPFIAMLKDYL